MKNQLLREIIKEVNEKGAHYVPLEVLKPAFGCDGKHNLCVKERLLIWAVENRIIYEYREVNQATVVRFFVRDRDS